MASSPSQMSPRTPLLRVDTESRTSSHMFGDNHLVPDASVTSPRHSNVQPISPATRSSLQIPVSPNTDPTSSPHLGNVASSNHARSDSRKLLALLLDQLQNRPRPPTVFEAFNIYEVNMEERGMGQALGAFRDAVKQRGTSRQKSTQSMSSHKEVNGDEGEVENIFSTDATVDLMVKLKEVLLLSSSQGWQIFEESASRLDRDGSHRLAPRSPLSSFRLRSNSLQFTGRRSRSPSPTPEVRTGASELFSQCLQVLASVISEDCRFQVSSPKPFRPSNTLQALTLDIALFLIHVLRHDPKSVSKIGFAVIPAFATFPPEMQPRLLAFFEEGLLRGVFEDLNRMEGNDETLPDFPTSEVTGQQVSNHDNIPMVSIQLDESPNDPLTASINSSWIPWTTQSFPCKPDLKSSNAPHQPLPIYYLSSMTAPLLAAILESVDIASSSLSTIHRTCRLVNLLVTSKRDAYLDVLEVVAYHTSKTRRAALSLLHTFWPKALGHPVVSKPLPLFSYAHKLIEGGHVVNKVNRTVDHPFAHQFVAWRFQPSSQSLALGDPSFQGCHSCLKPVEGFGLLCPFCMCVVHFDCYDYPQGSFVSQYTMIADPSTQKIAAHRFCYIYPSRRDSEIYAIRKEYHIFRLANIFTLTPCFLCHEPIWGYQALVCSICKCFAHNSCLDKATSPNLQRCRHASLDSGYITVDLSLVRRSFTDYYRDICVSPEEVMRQTYEELSVFYTVLWTQLQAFNHGMALGTIIIENKGSDDHEAVAFELQYYVELYEAHLLPGKLPVSAILGEYFEENAAAPSFYFLFDWSNLTYIASIIKSPYEQHQPSFDTSHDLLNVVQAEGFQQDAPDNPRHPFEVVALGHMRDCLGYEFNLFSDTAARLCLSHLHSLGFFTRSDSKPILFHSAVKEDIQCESPLPLGFDLSTDVETLVSAIEACLSDIDLSVNEMGLLLLVRKFWPNGMASEYAWRRLSQTVLLWILQEDDNMATIVRDYISQHRPLPGIRSPAETPPWPAPNSQRRAPATSFNNGGDYVASRQALLGRYVGQWLLALHNQRIEDYAKIMFCAIKETAKSSAIGTALLPGEYSSLREKDAWASADKMLRFIIKLCQNSVVFDTFDDLFLVWLSDLEHDVQTHASLPSLQRLFNREAETTSRFSTIIDATLTSADTSSLYSIDPWRIVHKTARESREGFSRSLNWLRLFARSGVDITVVTFVEFASRAREYASSLADCSILVDAAFLSTWLRSMGRQELQSIFSPLHSYLSPSILQQMKSGNAELAQVDLLRKSLATCLLLYGCERGFLRSLGLVTKDDISYLPSRRKTNTRASKASDPIIVDSAFINILGNYVAAGIDEVAGLVAKFLYAFITHAPLVESYEVDNFILRNGSVLCSCIWQFYDIQSHELSSIRIALLLRVLVVDTHPFQAILNDLFQSDGNWQLRFLALMRIFRIILDVTSPAFHVEGRQWRSSTLEIYYHYFKAGWADEKEEIRVAVDTWSQTLLPAHFEAISSCWNEAIGIAPISERVRLVSFLIQLHPHFPSWKVISWDVIIETLLEDDYLQKNGDDEDGPAAAHLSMYGLSSEKGHQLSDIDPEISQLRVSIVLLSLKMLASGIEIDVFSFLKLKLHLVKIIGFEDVALVPATNGRAFHIQLGDLEDIPEDAYPCIDEFPAVLDARHAFDLPPSAMASPFTSDDNPSPGLIGTVLVDVVLATFCSISDPFLLPVLSMKNLFESLMIIIYKHDFDSTALKHLDFMLRKAMRKTLEFLLLDLSYEMRQLALSIVQAYTKRFSFISGSLVIESVEKAVALVVSLDHNGEDMLVSQARAYIENTLNMLTSSGIFCGLCKRNLEPEFFTVLKHIVSVNAKANSQPSERLSERLLQSVLSQPLDANWSITQLVVDNIDSYVKVVHHEDYGAQLIRDTGGWLTTVARRMSYVQDANCDPLLLMLSILLGHNKVHSRELLSYMVTVLRVALSRSNVKKATLLSIMNTTSDLYRDHQSAGNQAQANEVALAMLDVLEDILRLKARVSPSTLTAIAETVLSTDVNTYTSVDQSFFAVLRNLASSGLYFLQNHVWSSTICDEELSASLAVAKIILRAADFSPTVVPELISDHLEKFSRINTSMRTWNVLTLAALSDTSGQHGTILFSHFSAFTPAYYASLGTYVYAKTLPPETAVADIDHAYLSIKLWLLLAQTMSPSNDKVDPGALSTARDDRADLAIKTVWNELWPPFESIVESCIKTENSPLATIVCSSVANLFLLVYQLRCGISLDALSQAHLLTRLQRQHRKNSAINKLSRAMDGEPLPDIQLDVLLDQATKDLANAEKLRILDRESQRPPPDRQRRDVRIPT